MIKKLKIVKVNHDYCDYLRKFDNKIIYNAGLKELRPFIGVLFIVDNKEYFAPLSSPKNKHKGMRNMLDFIKIDKGNLGAINLNNMIPVKKNNYILFDLNKKAEDESENKRIYLLKDQLFWMNRNIEKIENNAIKLYNKYINNELSSSIKNRCCNFPLLEQECDNYNKQYSKKD